MQYLTYDEYKGIGGTLDETAFNRKITRACGIITNATHGRIEALHGIPKQVKECCRDIIEILEKTDGVETIQSRSQSAGGVSESVSYAAVTKEERAEQINGIIHDYLFDITTKDGVSVLYRGCSC